MKRAMLSAALFVAQLLVGIGTLVALVGVPVASVAACIETLLAFRDVSIYTQVFAGVLAFLVTWMTLGVSVPAAGNILWRVCNRIEGLREEA